MTEKTMTADEAIAEAQRLAEEAERQPKPPRTAQGRRRPSGSKEAPPKNPADSLKEEEPQAGRTGRKPPRRGTLEDRLAQFLAGTSMLPAAMGDQYAAHIISTRSAPMASAWAELAKENPRVKRILEGMLEGGAWSGVVVTSAAVLIPLMGHYGMLPGVGDPFMPFYPQPPQGVTQNVHQRKPKAPKGAPRQGNRSSSATSVAEENGGRPTHVTVGDKIPPVNPHAAY